MVNSKMCDAVVVGDVSVAVISSKKMKTENR